MGLQACSAQDDRVRGMCESQGFTLGYFSSAPFRGRSESREDKRGKSRSFSTVAFTPLWCPTNQALFVGTPKAAPL